MRWELRRNCALAPRQATASMAGLAGLALLVGLAFSWFGYPMVLTFACLEAIGLSAALVGYARRATDREIIELDDARLVVEQWHAGRMHRTELPAGWARVEQEDPKFVLLIAGGVTVAIGQHVTLGARSALCREIRSALKRPMTRVGSKAGG